MICRHIILKHTVASIHEWCEDFRPPRYIYQRWQPDETTKKQLQKMVENAPEEIVEDNATPKELKKGEGAKSSAILGTSDLNMLGVV